MTASPRNEMSAMDPTRATPRPPRARRRLVCAIVTCAAVATACSSGGMHPNGLASDHASPTATGGHGTFGDASTLSAEASIADAADSGSDSDSGSGSDADSGSDSGSDASPPACSTLTADGPAVADTAGTGTPPDATGGPVFEGTYWLTARTNYGGTPDARLLQRTLVVTTAGWTVVEGRSSGDAGVSAFTSRAGTWSLTDATLLTVDLGCPGPRTVDHVRFSAGGPTLYLFPTNEVMERYDLQ
jgi:hypothetical protein